MGEMTAYNAISAVHTYVDYSLFPRVHRLEGDRCDQLTEEAFGGPPINEAGLYDFAYAPFF